MADSNWLAKRIDRLQSVESNACQPMPVNRVFHINRKIRSPTDISKFNNKCFLPIFWKSNLKEPKTCLRADRPFHSFWNFSTVQTNFQTSTGTHAVIVKDIVSWICKVARLVHTMFRWYAQLERSQTEQNSCPVHQLIFGLQFYQFMKNF